MTTVPSKDVKDVIAMNTTPLNNCLLNMVAIQERWIYIFAADLLLN